MFEHSFFFANPSSGSFELAYALFQDKFGIWLSVMNLTFHNVLKLIIFNFQGVFDFSLE